MTRPAGGFHPLIQSSAEAVGVRWSKRVGYEGIDGLLALAAVPTRGGIVLACQDSAGDSTATSLTPDDAADLRDALTAWLEEQ